jgi:hypothetical protein
MATGEAHRVSQKGFPRRRRGAEGKGRAAFGRVGTRLGRGTHPGTPEGGRGPRDLVERKSVRVCVGQCE